MSRRRILVVWSTLAVGGTLLVGGLIGLTAWQERQAHLSEGQTLVDTLADSAGAHLAFALDEAVHALSLAAEELAAQPRPDRNLDQTEARLARHARLAPGVVGLELIDLQGRLMAASMRPAVRAEADIAAYLAPYLDAAGADGVALMPLPGPAVRYGGLGRAREGEQAVPIGQFVTDPAGRAHAVLLALLDPQPLAGVFAMLDLGADTVALRDAQGTTLVHLLNRPNVAEAAPKAHEDREWAPGAGVVDWILGDWTRTAAGAQALIAMRPVPGYPLSVSVSMPVAHALQPWTRNLSYKILAGAGILLGMFGMGLLVSAQAARERRARSKAREDLRRELDDAARFQRVLTELAKQDKSNYELTLKALLQVSADTLQVERVSYWVLESDFNQLACRHLYRRTVQCEERGQSLLSMDQAPEYFAAIHQHGVLAVHEACSDRRTRGFADQYLKPLGISSLLDAPVLLRGTLVGILCHEHVGPPRMWDEREQAFARAVAEMIALSLEAAERKAAEQALLRERELAQVTLEAIADAVIRTDPLGKVEYLNRVAQRLTGWAHKEAVGSPLGEVLRLLEEDTRAPLEPALACVVRGAPPARGTSVLLIARDGREYAVEETVSPLCDAQGETIGAVLVFRDVTERERIHRELAYQATHDSLTRLFNRREFERRLAALLEPAGPAGTPHALLYVDLDQFKLVNDTCGHPAGDELLRRLTKALAAVVSPPNTLARLGGDEFGVLLMNCSVPTAQAVAGRLLETIRRFRFPWEDKVFSIGASIGVVPIDGAQTLPVLLAAADAACYAAKDKGRNRIQLYTPGDQDLVRRRDEMNWVARITRALEDNRFELFYQPIRATVPKAGDLPHDEILLRLREPNGSLVLPYAFIPAAERYNLMPTIDQWVVQRVFESLRVRRLTAPGEPLGTVSINLSGHSLGDESFAGFIREQFERYEVPYDRVCFEITESAAIAHLECATRFLREMRALGCTTALDDFGTGLSSFAYLKTLAADYLKIDGSFIRGMQEDPAGEAIVEAIHRVGHLMGIKTVAEFVETEAVLQRLREMGVDYVQGHVLQKAKPWPLTAPVEAYRTR